MNWVKMIGASVGIKDHITIERCPRIILLDVTNMSAWNLEFLRGWYNKSLNGLKTYEKGIHVLSW